MQYTVPSTRGFYGKPYRYSSLVLKIRTKKISETRKLESIVERKNEGRKPDKKLESKKTRVYVQKPQLKMSFKNSISAEGNA
jgi:hypothetical protein